MKTTKTILTIAALVGLAAWLAPTAHAGNYSFGVSFGYSSTDYFPVYSHVYVPRYQVIESYCPPVYREEHHYYYGYPSHSHHYRYPGPYYRPSYGWVEYHQVRPIYTPRYSTRVIIKYDDDDHRYHYRDRYDRDDHRYYNRYDRDHDYKRYDRDRDDDRARYYDRHERDRDIIRWNDRDRDDTREYQSHVVRSRTSDRARDSVEQRLRERDDRFDRDYFGSRDYDKSALSDRLDQQRESLRSPTLERSRSNSLNRPQMRSFDSSDRSSSSRSSFSRSSSSRTRGGVSSFDRR